MNIKNRKEWKLIVFWLLSFAMIVFFGQQVFAQNNVPNINGQWTYRANLFEFDGNACGHSDQVEESTVTINQRGSQFVSNGGIMYKLGNPANPAVIAREAIGEGKVENNQIQSRTQSSYRTFSWSGTISQDGNIISGNATCLATGVYQGRPYSNEDSFGFTLTRASRSNSNQTNSPSVTPQPSQTPGSLRQL